MLCRACSQLHLSLLTNQGTMRRVALLGGIAWVTRSSSLSPPLLYLPRCHGALPSPAKADVGHSPSALVQGLVSDSEEHQMRAAAAVKKLAEHAEGRTQVASAGAIPPVVTLLKSASAAVQQQAADALSHLAEDGEISAEIVSAGGIALLVSLLGSKSAAVQESGAGALASLGANGDNSVALVMAGAVGPLVSLLGSKSARVQISAARALGKLAVEEGIQVKEVPASTVLAQVQLLASSSAGMQECAAGVLWCLASNEENKANIKAAGAAPLLARLIESRPPAEVQLPAAGALSRLFCATKVKRAKPPYPKAKPTPELYTAAGGAVAPLVELLSSGPPGLQQQAAGALGGFASQGMGAEVADAGAIALLVSMLGSGTAGLQEQAAEALGSLAGPGGCAADVAAAGAIPPLVGLLPSGSSFVCQAVIAALDSLSSVPRLCKTGSPWGLSEDERRLMATAGIIHSVGCLLQHSSSNERVQLRALECLQCRVANGNELHMAASGAIPLLGSLLPSSSVAVQLAAVNNLQAVAAYRLSGQRAIRRHFMTAGIVAPLVSLLGSESLEVRQQGLSTVKHLTQECSKALNALIVGAGAVPLLVSLLQASSVQAVQNDAAETLRALVSEAGAGAAAGIAPLVGLLGSPATQASAASALTAYASTSSGRDKVVASGAVPLLVGMLRPGGSRAAEVAQVQAASALKALASTSSNRDVIVAAGAIPLMVGLLGSQSYGVPGAAAEALERLASSKKHKASVVAAGAVPAVKSTFKGMMGQDARYATALLLRLKSEEK